MTLSNIVRLEKHIRRRCRPGRSRSRRWTAAA